MFSVRLKLIYCIFVIAVLNPLVHQCSQTQSEELEKNANSMDSLILGFRAVSLNKSFPKFSNSSWTL